MFRLEGVRAGPADAPILTDVTIDLPGDGVTAIVGPSGAGKSTLLRLLNRLDDPLGGSIVYQDRPLTEWDPRELRRRVAMVFQRPPLFSGSVFDNLRVAEPGLTRAAAIELLDRVALGEQLLDREAADLSGGEAQRMCIARALLTEPSVVLADEPTAALDAEARSTVEELLLGIDGAALVWVTHDTDQLRRVADRAVVLHGGRVTAVGTLEELYRHPEPVVRASVGA